MKKSKKKRKISAWFIITLFAVLTAGAVYVYNKIDAVLNKTEQVSTKDTLDKKDLLSVKDLGDNASIDQIIKQEQDMAKYLDSVTRVNDPGDAKFGGEKITICITGIDSRIGTGTPHADANHLVTVWLDSGKVEITSVPRGTEADAGFPDTTTFNYLSNVRANKGREAYFKEMCRIAKIDKIDYYVEFGFSQAIRLLELLGFKDNAGQMLRVLRSRKVFQIGDYQRAYNQGQFIRQMILSKFDNLSGMFGELVIRGGLLVTDNNINRDVIKKIIERLKAKGFPHSGKDVIVKLRPKFTDKLSVFDFTTDNSRDSLYKYIAKRSSYADSSVKDKNLNDASNINDRVKKTLESAISKAKPMTEKNPKGAIKLLQRYYEQKAWYQISVKADREKIKNDMCQILIAAYNKSGNKSEAKKIEEILEVDAKLEKE